MEPDLDGRGDLAYHLRFRDLNVPQWSPTLAVGATLNALNFTAGDTKPQWSPTLAVGAT